MENSSSEEQALARRVAAERKAAGSGRVRFSVELRREAAALAAASHQPSGDVAATLGLSRSLLQSWVVAERGPVRPRRGTGDATQKPVVHKASLQRVDITDALTVSEESLELVFPSGVRLAGLTLAQLRALLGVSQ